MADTRGLKPVSTADTSGLRPVEPASGGPFTFSGSRLPTPVPGVPNREAFGWLADKIFRSLTSQRAGLYDAPPTEEMVEGMSPAERLFVKSADQAGGMAGALMQMGPVGGAMGGLLGKAGFAAPQVLGNVGAFGAHTALQPGANADEVADSMLLGAGLFGAHKIPGVEQLTRTTLGRLLWNSGLMGGMAAAEGAPPEDVAAAAVGGGVAGTVASPGYDPRKQFRPEVKNQESLSGREVVNEPPKAAADKDPIIAEVRKEIEQPIPGSRVSAALNPLRRGTGTLADAAKALSETRPEGSIPDSRIDQLQKEVKAERKAARAAGGLGEKYDRSSREEAEWRALKEDLPAEWMDWVENASPKARKWRLGQAARIDQLRMYQDIGGGLPTGLPQKGGKTFVNVPDRFLVRVKQDLRESAFRAKDEFDNRVGAILDEAGLKQNSPGERTVGRVIEEVYGAETPLSELRSRDWWKDVEKAGEEKVLATAERLHALSDEYHATLNTILESAGRGGADYRKGYFRKIEKRRRGIPRLGQRLKEAWEGRDQPREGRPLPERVAISSVKPRTDSPGNREWGARRVMSDYSADIVKKSIYQLGLNHDFALARSLELAGRGDLAEIIRRYSESDFNDIRFGAAGKVDADLAEGGIPGVGREVFTMAGHALRDAVFTANVAWNLGIQPTSAAFSTAAYFVHPAKTIASKEFRKLFKGESFVRKVKGRKYGTISEMGSGGDILQKPGLVKETAEQKAKSMGQILNRSLESVLDMYSGSLAWSYYKKLGLSGRALLDAASDASMKHQSVYDTMGSPEILRSKAYNLIQPFQRFAWEFKRNVDEGLGIRGGHYKLNANARARVGYAARAMISFLIAAEWAKQLGRTAYGLGSIPGYGLISGEGLGGGLIFPATVIQNMLKTRKDIIDGRYGKAAARLTRQFAPGGVLISNFINTVDHVYGEDPPFRISKDVDHFWVGVFAGIYNTPEGKEYLEKRKPRDERDADKIESQNPNSLSGRPIENVGEPIGESIGEEIGEPR